MCDACFSRDLSIWVVSSSYLCPVEHGVKRCNLINTDRSHFYNFSNLQCGIVIEFQKKWLLTPTINKSGKWQKNIIIDSPFTILSLSKSTAEKNNKDVPHSLLKQGASLRAVVGQDQEEESQQTACSLRDSKRVSP